MRSNDSTQKASDSMSVCRANLRGADCKQCIIEDMWNTGVGTQYNDSLADHVQVPVFISISLEISNIKCRHMHANMHSVYLIAFALVCDKLNIILSIIYFVFRDSLMCSELRDASLISYP